ncbi:hypothetical protein IWW45_002429 [Coemansia sp. RSA 485]|nr:hypothetical protein IWW45_002429 [Coemansia sp. RSA 485]
MRFAANRVILALLSASALTLAWPVVRTFRASEKLPSTWTDAKLQSDIGALRVSNSMFIAQNDGSDSLISFSIQPSLAANIPAIYAVAYSLETGQSIMPVGKVSTSDLAPLGFNRGGMVSIRIPDAVVKLLAKTSGANAARLALIAPKAPHPESTGLWASDSAVFVLTAGAPENADSAISALLSMSTTAPSSEQATNSP